MSGLFAFVNIGEICGAVHELLGFLHEIKGWLAGKVLVCLFPFEDVGSYTC